MPRADSPEPESLSRPATAAGRRVALEALHADAWRWALSCCRGRSEAAEEALHDAYVAILDGRARYRGEAAFKTFVFGVIRMTARATSRRSAWRAMITRPFSAEDAPSAEASQDRGVRTPAVDAALNALSPRQRAVAELVLIHDFTLSEAAEALALSRGTAARHYDAAKTRLRVALGVTNGAAP